MRTVVVTTSAGRDELTRRGAATLSSVEVRALNSSSGSIDPLAILRIAAVPVWGEDASPRGRAYIVWAISGGRSSRRTFSDAVTANRGPQGRTCSTSDRAGGRVCAGIRAMVSNTQRQGKRCVSIHALRTNLSLAFSKQTQERLQGTSRIFPTPPFSAAA